MKISRRHLLAGSIAGGVTLGLGCAPPARVSTPRRRSLPRLPQLPALVELIRETPRGDILDRVARLIARGLTTADLTPALQLAPAGDVVPRTRLGPDQHSHFMVYSAALASKAASPREAWYPPLQPFPGSRKLAAGQAPAEMARGMETWDRDLVESSGETAARGPCWRKCDGTRHTRPTTTTTSSSRRHSSRTWTICRPGGEPDTSPVASAR